MALYLGSTKIGGIGLKSEASPSLLRTVSDNNGTLIMSSTIIDSALDSTSSNGVENRAVTTALNNKLDINASNLTTTGQKVFDGQWVKSSHGLVSSGTLPTSVASRIEIDLSEYLPDDNYFYEVALSGVVFVGDSDARCTLSVYGKDNEISYYMCRAVKAKDSSAGNCIVSIGTSRTVVVDYWSANAGIFDLNMKGYRRIGTNI